MVTKMLTRLWLGSDETLIQILERNQLTECQKRRFVSLNFIQLFKRIKNIKKERIRTDVRVGVGFGVL